MEQMAKSQVGQEEETGPQPGNDPAGRGLRLAAAILLSSTRRADVCRGPAAGGGRPQEAGAQQEVWGRCLEQSGRVDHATHPKLPGALQQWS